MVVDQTDMGNPEKLKEADLKNRDPFKQEADRAKSDRIYIIINERKVIPPKSTMSGSEIKKLGGCDDSFLLVKLDPDKLDDEGMAIADDFPIQFENGMKFRLVNSATFGSISTTIPPSLDKDLEELKKKGYELEVKTSGSCIGIILKDYRLPKGVWDCDKIDLLVVALDTYPNAPMDMFWVRPELRLRDKSVPNGASNVDMFGQMWQQFSWHTQNWNPIRNSIITHLDVVRVRLGKAE